MVYVFFADFIVLIHFLWILFMVVGFLLTFIAFFGVYVFRSAGRFGERFFDRWVFRSVHLLGIVYVGGLAACGKYCPLTYAENSLRSKEAGESYAGSFIVHYIEKIVYPEVEAIYIIAPTVMIALFVLGMFIVRPPKQFLPRGR